MGIDYRAQLVVGVPLPDELIVMNGGWKVIKDMFGYGQTIGGLTLFRPDDEDDTLVLGQLVLETESNRSGGSPASTTASKLDAIIVEVRRKLEALSVTEEVQAYCILDVS